MFLPAWLTNEQGIVFTKKWVACSESFLRVLEKFLLSAVFLPVFGGGPMKLFDADTVTHLFSVGLSFVMSAENYRA